MHEPRNDEERKALRLCNKVKGLDENGFTGPYQRDWWIASLAEARAIVREELGAGSVATPYDAREAELAQVRADITRTALVAQAFNPNVEYEEHEEQVAILKRLLARERELMAKSEPEGGDRG